MESESVQLILGAKFALVTSPTCSDSYSKVEFLSSCIDIIMQLLCLLCFSINVDNTTRDDPKYICAVGFEPNPNHVAPLREIELSFAKCGWRAHFFTKTAVSNYTGTTQFYTDNEMGHKVSQ